jgi:hypothetical protein
MYPKLRSLAAGFLMAAPLTVTAKSEVIIFIDKSASVSFVQNGALLPKCREGSAAAMNLLKGPGDRISGFYLHKGAGAASNFLQGIAPAYGDTTTPLKKNAAKKHFAAALNKLQQGWHQKILSILQDPTNKQVAGSSPILKSLEIASANLTPGSSHKLVYFSDMVECSAVRKTLAPKSKQDAIALAQKDAAAIKTAYDINPGVLKGSQVDVYLPQSAMGTAGNENIPYYWRELFRQYGMTVTFH